MITFQQLIAVAFHAVDPHKEASGDVFEGTEGGRVPNFKSGAGIQLYRHDALDSNGQPLYMFYNPKSDSCLLAQTAIPFRDKHFLTEEAKEYTSAEDAFEVISRLYSGEEKKVIGYKR